MLHFFNRDYDPTKLPKMKKFVFKTKQGNELIEELKSKASSISTRVFTIEELK